MVDVLTMGPYTGDSPIGVIRGSHRLVISYNGPASKVQVWVGSWFLTGTWPTSAAIKVASICYIKSI